METKPLAFGIVGFLIGGLVVSIAATQLGGSQMTNDLKNKTGDDFDRAFISSMIEHHQDAIDMAKLAEKNAKHDEIKDISDDIMITQSKEIDTMKNWQKQWGYTVTAERDSMQH